MTGLTIESSPLYIFKLEYCLTIIMRPLTYFLAYDKVYDQGKMCKRETNYCQTVLEYKYVKRATFYRQTRHHKSSSVRNAKAQRTLPSHLLLCKELV